MKSIGFDKYFKLLAGCIRRYVHAPTKSSVVVFIMV